MTARDRYMFSAVSFMQAITWFQRGFSVTDGEQSYMNTTTKLITACLVRALLAIKNANEI